MKAEFIKKLCLGAGIFSLLMNYINSEKEHEKLVRDTTDEVLKRIEAEETEEE